MHITNYDVDYYLHNYMGGNINTDKCIKLWEYIKTNLKDAPGSSNNHQNWNGGYISHIQDMMNYATSLYELLTYEQQLNFSFSDALLVIFLHDIEKPFKYGFNSNFTNPDLNEDIRNNIIKEYEIILTDKQLNAIKYIHGEGSDYKKDKRVMNELCAFCHCCDIISSRIYYNKQTVIYE